MPVPRAELTPPSETFSPACAHLRSSAHQSKAPVCSQATLYPSINRIAVSTDSTRPLVEIIASVLPPPSRKA